MRSAKGTSTECPALRPERWLRDWECRRRHKIHGPRRVARVKLVHRRKFRKLFGSHSKDLRRPELPSFDSSTESRQILRLGRNLSSFSAWDRVYLGPRLVPEKRVYED